MVGAHLMAADIALAEVEWLARKHTVEVIIIEGDDILLGTEMLDGTRLAIDYVARTVLVETL